METRFTYAQRPLVILAAVLLAVLGVFATGGPARADDLQSGDQSQSGDYTPVGIGELFQAPDATQGQDPTLYEKYPDGAYSFDYEDLGTLHVRRYSRRDKRRYRNDLASNRPHGI